MDFNVNVKVSLDDDAKAFLAGIIASLKATTSTVGAISQTVVETKVDAKPATTKPAATTKVQEPDTAAEKKAEAEAEEARQIAAAAAKKKAEDDEAFAAKTAKNKADAEAEAERVAAEAAKTEAPVDPLDEAPAVEELTIQVVKEKLGAYRAIEGTAALMTLLGKYGAKDLATLEQKNWAAIVADAG